MGSASEIEFDAQTLESGLWDIADSHNLSDDEFKLIASLASAISGTHRSVRVEIEGIPEGVTPRRIKERRRQSIARRVADHIDLQVADGVKQESAIEDACKRFRRSRREVFRMLREVRALRLQWADWDCPYDGYEIASDGRLVPKDNSG